MVLYRFPSNIAFASPLAFDFNFREQAFRSLFVPLIKLVSCFYDINSTFERRKDKRYPGSRNTNHFEWSKVIG